MLVFVHKLTCRVVAFYMCPRAREMQNEFARLPLTMLIVIAFDLFGKGVQFRLGRDDEPLRVWLFLHDTHQGVLLAVVFALVGVAEIECTVDEFEGSVVCAYQEGSQIEAVAVVGEDVVNIVGMLGILQLFVDYVGNIGIGVGDERVEVEPPYPVILCGLDQPFDHVELPIDRVSSFAVLFVVDNEVITVTAGVV